MAPETSHVERFRATSGTFTGVLTVAAGVGIVVLACFSGDGVWWPGLGFGALLGWLGWVVLLRPRVWLEGRHLVLRQMLSTVRIPLAAIDSVVARQFLVVLVGDDRYVSTSVGGSGRRLIKESMPGGKQPGDDAVARAQHSYHLFVEDRINARVRDARAVEQSLADGVRRTWAWPELGAVGAIVAFVVVALIA